MLDELTEALETYRTNWNNLVAQCNDQEFFVSLKPTAVAWKTKDLGDFDKRFNELRDLCDQVHIGWVNERWLATLHLKESSLPWEISTIKLMQRRPGSGDATGLDHVDFYLPQNTESAKTVAEKESFKWTEEKNGEHCKWLSIWFDDTEAKLRSDTVYDVCAQELKDVEKLVLG